MTHTRISLLIPLALLILLLSPLSVQAATITVSNSCSLANAIRSANQDSATGGCTAGSGDDVIVVDGRVTLTFTLPIISSNIRIQGGGTIDGVNSYRGLHVENGHLELVNMTITRGRNLSGNGGGIRVEGNLDSDSKPSFTLTNTTVSSSAAVNANGGGISFDSGGALSISNSRIINNSATVQGGGLYISNQGSQVAGEKSIQGSVFSGNNAASGGAIASSGTNSSFTLDRSAIHGNSATNQNGIIRADRGFVMKNSTVYGNSGTHASSTAIHATALGGDVTLTHVTIANNTLVHGIAGSNFSAAYNVYNSIIAGSSGNDCNVTNGFDAQAGNLIEDNTCSPAVTGDPMLAATAAGSPPYLLPQAGSPAIDAADATQCATAGIESAEIAGNRSMSISTQFLTTEERRQHREHRGVSENFLPLVSLHFHSLDSALTSD